MPLWTPVYLPLAAAALRGGGHEVSLLEFDRIAAPAAAPEGAADLFRAAIGKLSPGVVLFDVPLERLADFARCGALAREAAPSALLLAGGRHPTLVPEETLAAHPFLDGIVIGEPEETLLEIAAGAPLAGVPGTAARTGGAVSRARPRPPLADLDRIPPPAWDLLEMGYHTGRTLRAIPCLPLRTATVLSSRGCPGVCRFCAEGRLYPAPHRWHSAARVVADVERLVAAHGVEGIYFQDETFLGNRDRVAALCDEFVRSGLAGRIVWAAQVRTDSVDAGILALMRRAGCVQLEFGIESGSPRLLERLGKGETLATHETALRLARRAGIRTLASVMIGTPGETAGDARLTDGFLARTRPTIVRLIRYIPMPGTPLVRDLVAAGRLAPRFWQPPAAGGGPAAGSTPNLSEMSDAELLRAERALYRRRVFPAYLADVLRHARPRDYTALLRSGFLPYLLSAASFHGARPEGAVASPYLEETVLAPEERGAVSAAARHAIEFDLFGTRVRLSANTTAPIAGARRELGIFEVPLDPGRPPDVEIAALIEEGREPRATFVAGERAWRLRGEELVAWAHLTLVHLAEARVRTAYLAHAGCVSLGGRGVVIAAPSRMGKSTLTAHLAVRGAGLLSDELAPLERASGLVLPASFPVGIRPGVGEPLLVGRETTDQIFRSDCQETRRRARTHRSAARRAGASGRRALSHAARAALGVDPREARGEGAAGPHRLDRSARRGARRASRPACPRPVGGGRSDAGRRRDGGPRDGYAGPRAPGRGARGRPRRRAPRGPR